MSDEPCFRCGSTNDERVQCEPLWTVPWAQDCRHPTHVHRDPPTGWITQWAWGRQEDCKQGGIDTRLLPETKEDRK